MCTVKVKNPDVMSVACPYNDIGTSSPLAKAHTVSLLPGERKHLPAPPHLGSGSTNRGQHSSSKTKPRKFSAPQPKSTIFTKHPFAMVRKAGRIKNKQELH